MVITGEGCLCDLWRWWQSCWFAKLYWKIFEAIFLGDLRNLISLLCFEILLLLLTCSIFNMTNFCLSSMWHKWRLEASSVGVDIYPSSPDNSNKNFAVKNLSDADSLIVGGPQDHDLSSAAKAPFSSQVWYYLRFYSDLVSSEIAAILVPISYSHDQNISWLLTC